jgi:adenylate cyclase
MATFGTPVPGPRDALNALAAARDMLESIEAWSRKRQAAGRLPIRLSIGLHYGPVVLGDIGSERRLEFAVLGDTVNVANRLEAHTRVLDCRVLASDALVEQARHESPAEAELLLAGFRPGAPQSLRGRVGQVGVWLLERREAARQAG